MMLDRESVLDILKELNSEYKNDGILIVAIFGSFAEGKSDKFSDIDIAYEIDYEKFSKKYKDGFSKLKRINEIRDKLSKKIKKRVDLVPIKNIKGDHLIYV